MGSSGIGAKVHASTGAGGGGEGNRERGLAAFFSVGWEGGDAESENAFFRATKGREGWLARAVVVAVGMVAAP